MRRHSLAWLCVSVAAAAALPGCNRGGGERTDELQQSAQLPHKVPVAKFAGHVSIDGQTPDPKDGTLFVILNDPAHFKPGGKVYTPVDEQGNFVFATYATADGAPTGKYVVTFAQLHTARNRGGGFGGSLSMKRDFGGADSLKNLYNDPEKNKDNPTFVVEIAEPGRTDYDFNLQIAGKEPVKAPGPFAAKQLSITPAPKL
jgi:hypothetical protein